MTTVLRQTRRREFPGTVAVRSDAEAWLTREFRALGLASDAEFAIGLCLEELFINAVRHGQANRASFPSSRNLDGVRLEFVRRRRPFDPSRRPPCASTDRPDDFEIGG